MEYSECCSIYRMANGEGPIQAKQIEIGKMLSIKNDNINNNIADDDKSECAIQYRSGPQSQSQAE